MTARLTGVSPTVVAQGLIAACAHFEIAPTEVMQPGAGSNARTALGAAIMAMLPRRGPKDGVTQAIGHMLQLNPTYLAPSGLRLRSIGPELLLDLAEVLKGAGFDPATVSVTRQRPPTGTPGTPGAPRTAPAAPAAPAVLKPAAKPVLPPPVGKIAQAPVVSNLRRWTRQFLNAGWSPREVAKLFDLQLAQVKAEALAVKHG